MLVLYSVVLDEALKRSCATTKLAHAQRRSRGGIEMGHSVFLIITLTILFILTMKTAVTIMLFINPIHVHN